MCGIVGILNRGGAKVAGEDVERMVEVLSHRGPDDQGVYVNENIGLGHRRLSIIDLSSAGRQPMLSDDGRHVLVFNGEIYNYRELAKRFYYDRELNSSSDTEVLLNLLIDKGRLALSYLKGMFALAFWDGFKKELLLAKDPFGKKPLYYFDDGRSLLFSSEVKSLLNNDLVSGQVDRELMPKYFLYEYVPSPGSGLGKIEQLPMGSFMEANREGKSVESWWRPKMTPKRVFVNRGGAIKEFDSYLRKAVERRLVADVPVGLLLSGGIDSTSIGWYMRELSSSLIHSFSVSFEERSFNEAEMASTAAESLGTEHHNVVFGINEFKQSLKEIIEIIDVPFGDSSLLPTYWVSKEARKRVKVALDGDGSDELLAGYGTFKAAEVSEKLPKVSSGGWHFLSKMASKIPTRYEYFSLDFKIKYFLRGLSYTLPYRNQMWLGSFSEEELKKLLRPGWSRGIKNVFEDIDCLSAGLEKLEVVDVVSLLTIHHYLHNDILVKLDRASMAASLEARTPFLDVDLANYVMRLPVEYKRDKYILKKTMKGRVPNMIISRPKKGFAVPLGYWLRGPLGGWVRKVLDEEKIRQDGVLEWEYVYSLIKEHQRGQADHRKKLWTVLMWQLWYDRWVKKETHF